MHAGLDAQSVLQKFGKGKPIPAIIEAVSSGTNLKATLLPDQYFVTVMLVGVSCPSMNRRPVTGAGQPPAAPAANGRAPAATSEAAEPATNGTAGITSSHTAVLNSVSSYCSKPDAASNWRVVVKHKELSV